MKEIANAIRNNDLKAYQELRYPSIPDGEMMVFEDEDFSRTDLGAFAMGFTAFKRCILDEAKNLYGQPIEMTDCSAKNIDFSDAHIVLHATNTDFTGMKYTAGSVFAVNENNSPSTFKNCTLGDDALRFLDSQGAFIE